MAPKLPPSTQKMIEKEIAKIFESLKVRLLSPIYQPNKDLILKPISHDKILSLPGMFASAYANTNNADKPSMEAVKGLVKVTEAYVDAAKEKATERAITAVREALTNSSNEDFNYEQELNDALINVFDQAHGETKKVVETELHRAKTVGLQEGILDVMIEQGIDDPTVAFLTRQDAYVCKYCKEFYCLPDGTPRVYKLSELKSGYFDRKAPEPVAAPLHPNCFLSSEGRILTKNGFKRLAYVKMGDEVLTHKMRYQKVINTLNWNKTPYRGAYTTLKLHSNNEAGLLMTPEHQLLTPTGMRQVSQLRENDKLIKVVEHCVTCNKTFNYDSPKLFCNKTCRDKFLNNVTEYADNLSNVKFKTEEFAIQSINHYKSSHPTFLHDITVEEDESFFINGIASKNCRCLMISIFDGFGFDNGKLQYISSDHDEWENQKQFRKSISEDFLNHDCNDKKHKVDF